MKKILGIIPARYKSSRFPGKPLVDILGKPMIIRVAETLADTIGKENTIVATDDDRIKNLVQSSGFRVIMTSDSCKTGTDRLWEVAQKEKADIYINVQGDEPMVLSSDIQNIIDQKNILSNYIINGMKKIGGMEDPNNVNIPKVLTNKNNELIYMSRLPIPGVKDGELKNKLIYWKQVCIYAFNYNELKAFGMFGEKAYYEDFEDIEILRFFDTGNKIKMVETSGLTLAVDVPSDVLKVELALRKLDEI